MRLSVATNFDDNLIMQIKDYPVVEIYGKLRSDFIGGGRASLILSPLSIKRFLSHVKLAQKHNIAFNYLINAACLDNREITKSGQKEIRKLLDWISDTGIRHVTVCNILLLRIIKKCYPQINVKISTFAGIDNVFKAKFWEENGADVLSLDNAMPVNREIETLKAIKKAVHCDIELIANSDCNYSCSLSLTHKNLNAHGSQSGHATKGFVVDYCKLECYKMKLKDPVNYIRAGWIRPEDIHYYEEIGYDRFKLTERDLATQLLAKRVKAYGERHYDGNLIDLIQNVGFDDKPTLASKYKSFIRYFVFLFKPFKVNLFKLKNTYCTLWAKRKAAATRDGVPPVFIDNKQLNGFFEKFLASGCRDMDCDKCRYCHKYAEKAVKIDPQYRKECLADHDLLDSEFASGKFWSYR